MKNWKKITGNIAGYLTVKGEQLKESVLWREEEGMGLLEYGILALVTVALGIFLYKNMKDFFSEFITWIINKIKTTFGM